MEQILAAENQSRDHAATILLVDDDDGIRDLVSEFLSQHGYRVETAPDARAMALVLGRGPVDLVVLDVMMPGEDGLSICRRLTGHPNAPAVIMLSAMAEDTDRIVGLELGADDYITKPCNPRELLARVKAVLRRRREPVSAEGAAPATICHFSGWRLDMVRRELRSPQGVMVNLSSGEFSLLKVFVERSQRILTRDQLLDLAPGRDNETYDRAIDVQISRLRKKLDDTAGQAELIRTLRNEGYMFVPKVTRST